MKKLKHAPWYLVVGAPACGKTSLLKSIEPHLFDHHFNIINVQHPNQSTICWLSEQGIFIEAQLQNNWKKIFKTCKNIPIVAAILVIDAETLQSNALTDFNALVSKLNFSLPTYIILAKFDLVEGFTAFNEDVSQEEREQVFGFSLQRSTTVETFEKQFNQWITKLNQQLIWRLHKEHVFINRAAIKDFPVHIQKLKPQLLKMLRQLQNNNKLQIEAVYFTSAIPKAGFPSAQPYFIHAISQLLQKRQKTHRQQLQPNRYARMAFAGCSILLTIVISGWLISYQFNKKQVTEIRTLLTHFRSSNNLSSNSYYVNQLQTAKHALQSKQHWYNQLGLGQNEKLNNILQQQYKKIIQKSHYQSQSNSCKTISECLSAINNLIDFNASVKPTIKINQALINLRQQLEPLAHNQKLAFILASQRMQAKINNDPLGQLFQITKNIQAPWKNWLTQLANDTWQAILNSSKVYINQQWQEIVLPEYKKNIINHFPIFSDNRQQISLNDFTNFFGPDGTLTTFFNTYLKPFINTSSWEWKKTNSKSIAFSNNALNIFIRAQLIQQMFFQDKNRKLTVNFTLVPIQLEGNATDFKLKYGNKILNFVKHAPILLHWPTRPSLVEAVFMNNKENFTVLKETGPWAWFKMINEARLINLKNTTQYYLILQANNVAAKYKLIANNIDNPFIPNIINHFRCPQVLM